VCLRQGTACLLFFAASEPSLWSVQRVTSVPNASHGTIDIDGIRIDLQLPTETLSLHRSVVVAKGWPSFVTVVVVGSIEEVLLLLLRIGIGPAASKTADRKNVSPQRDLDVFLADVWHLDRKQETGFVLLDRDAVVFVHNATGAVVGCGWCR